jgi:hypothetical protein
MKKRSRWIDVPCDGGEVHKIAWRPGGRISLTGHTRAEIRAMQFIHDADGNPPACFRILLCIRKAILLNNVSMVGKNFRGQLTRAVGRRLRRAVRVEEAAKPSAAKPSIEKRRWHLARCHYLACWKQSWPIKASVAVGTHSVQTADPFARITVQVCYTGMLQPRNEDGIWLDRSTFMRVSMDEHGTARIVFERERLD